MWWKTGSATVKTYKTGGVPCAATKHKNPRSPKPPAERNKRGRTIQRKDNENPILLYSIDKKKSSSLGIKIQIRYFFGKNRPADGWHSAAGRAVLWVLRQNSACRAPTAGKRDRQGVIRPAVRPGSAAAFFGQRGGAAAHHGQHIHRHQQLGEGHGEPDGPRIEQQQSLLVKENHCRPGQAFQTILAFEAENLAIVQRCPSPS